MLHKICMGKGIYKCLNNSQSTPTVTGNMFLMNHVFHTHFTRLTDTNYFYKTSDFGFCSSNVNKDNRPTNWNKIPIEIRHATSLSHFLNLHRPNLLIKLLNLWSHDNFYIIIIICFTLRWWVSDGSICTLLMWPDWKFRWIFCSGLI